MGHNITIPNVHTDVNGRLLQADARLIRVAEHIGTFLKDGQMRRPNAWRDLVPYSQYEPYNGESQTTNIFRGTLGEQSGLSAWAKVEASRRGIAGTQEPVDACSYQPKTYDWAIESLSYTGYKRSWKSPVLCVRDFYTIDKAKEQLAMILKAGSAVVDDTRVTFQREMYMYFAALAGHFVVMTSGFNDFIDDATTRVSFDPFVDDADGDEVLTFDASLLPNISTLNWDYLDYCKQWLTDMAPEGAFGMDSGMPMFMAMMDKNEFEQMVYNDANLREDFRYAKPQMLIEGFNMIVIDVDSGTPLAMAHELMKEYKFLTCTTKRHQTEGSDRFRLVIPINYELCLDAEDYKIFMENIRQWLPFPAPAFPCRW